MQGLASRLHLRFPRGRPEGVPKRRRRSSRPMRDMGRLIALNESPAARKPASGRIRGVTSSTVAQAPVCRNRPEYEPAAGPDEGRGRASAEPRSCPRRRSAERPYAVRRRPTAASRTAPKNSVRRSESRWGSRGAISARKGSLRIEATSSSRLAAGVANQLAYIHPKGRGQPLQRAQCGNRLAVFYF